ncbi:type II toxin-antitoxin system toxin RelE3 [soil metagenome]
MKVEYRKRFLKELAALPSGVRQQIERFAFEELPEVASLAETGRAERMTGFPGYYKVRFGSYRIGIWLADDTAVLERALHRRDIYRYFP